MAIRLFVPSPFGPLKGLVGAVAMLACIAALPVDGQDDPTEMVNSADSRAESVSHLGTTLLQQIASDHIERGSFAAAVPHLAELNRRLRESTDASAARARESILYYLGLGQLQEANLYGARTTFTRFLTAYPDAANASAAAVYRADTHYYLGELEDARTRYAEVRERFDPQRLEAELRAAFWERYADCVYAAKDWAEGDIVFPTMLQSAAQLMDSEAAAEKRAKAASYQLQAAMAREDFDAALAVLPDLSGDTGKTRYDLGLNLALLRGGDDLYAAGRHGEALYFYERVLRPATLRDYWRAELERGEAERIRIAGVDWFADRLLELDNELTQARARLAQLGDNVEEENKGPAVPDYTDALNFRIARCYLARQRHHEAYWAFVRLEQAIQERVDAVSAPGSTGPDFSEEAVYGQVKMAAACGRDDRVRTTARRYLRNAEFNRFIGDVGYELLQTEVRDGNQLAVRELAEAFMQRVRLDPNLQEAPKLVYLVGSTLIEENDLPGLRERFEPMLEEYPERGFSDGLLYWLGLVEVLQGQFKPALARFQHIQEVYPSGGYAEDAAYREGVCWFGLLKYPTARRKLEGFLVDYPDSRLVSEAHAMLGDLAAADGRTDAAINSYAASHDAGALLSPPNMSYINHAVFSGGRVLAEAGRWAEMAEWFEVYLRRWGADGRAGDAIYELGRAQVALGRTLALLDVWIEAILRFGNDPTDTGPDRMLAEYPRHYQEVRGESAVAVLRNALAIARANEQSTLQLRLAAVMRELGEEDPNWPRVTADNLDQASGAVLVAAARRAWAAGDAELATLAAETAVARQAWADYAEEGWAILAEVRTAGDDALGAIEAWRRLSDYFPASERAAEARLREGDLQRERGATREAIAAYRQVLQVREWRGVPWAEANYKIGLTHFEAGDHAAAFGFCQRVYVLYGGVEQWAAEAYLLSGLALEKMDRTADAVATYREFWEQENLRDENAAAKVGERLEALGAS